jgi:hypothetical protein
METTRCTLSVFSDGIEIISVGELTEAERQSSFLSVPFARFAG